MGEERSLSRFAAALRQARLSRALSINDVMKATLLSDKQILGLENDDHSYFYNPSYTAAAAESYAKLLGVDLALEGAPSRDNLRPPRLVISIDKASTPTKRKKLLNGQHHALLGLALVTILLIAYVFGSLEGRDITAEPITVDQVSIPVPKLAEDVISTESATSDTSAASSEAASIDWVPEDEVSPAPESGYPNPVDSLKEKDSAQINWDRNAKQNRFFIVIKRQTWISASDSLGRLMMDGVQAPTPGKRFEGRKPFAIVLDDADAVEIYYLGNRVRPNGKAFPGIVVTDRR